MATINSYIRVSYINTLTQLPIDNVLSGDLCYVISESDWYEYSNSTWTLKYENVPETIPTQGMVEGDICLNMSNRNYYIFNGTSWDIKYIFVMNPVGTTVIPSRDVTNPLYGICMSPVSLTKGFMNKDLYNVVMSPVSSSYRIDISRMISKPERYMQRGN